MIPGKKYKPEDYLEIAWARRWFIVVPLLVMAAGGIAYAQLQPNRYRAQTAILIIPQQVPTNFVPSTITTMLADRLQMISQEILSRTRLERIIEEFNLYRDMRAHATMEDAIERMRKDINVNIQPSRNRKADNGAFTVGFEADNARTALLVTERLASLFIKENLDDRAVLADATSQFLDTQLEEARRRLIDQEKKLEEYRRRNAGSLPTEVDSNLQGMQTTQMQLQALQEASNRDRDRRLFLERSLAEAQAEANAPPASDSRGSESTVTSSAPAAQRLEAARSMLRNLQLRLKAEHPDVVRMKRVITDLEKEAETEALQRPVSDGPAERAMSPAERNLRSRISAMQAELQTLDGRIVAREADERRLRAALGAYQARIAAAPTRESEMVELMRDYDTIKTSYNSLLAKSESSKLAVNLERRQIGEQFKIIDAARLPEKPVSPDRPRIMGMAAVFGLGFGLALVGLLEYRDSSFKSDDDVLAALALPVLALIPAMVTEAEQRTSVKRRRLIAVASVAVVVLMAGAAIWKLQLLDRWMH